MKSENIKERMLTFLVLPFGSIQAQTPVTELRHVSQCREPKTPPVTAATCCEVPRGLSESPDGCSRSDLEHLGRGLCASCHPWGQARLRLFVESPP